MDQILGMAISLAIVGGLVWFLVGEGAAGNRERQAEAIAKSGVRSPASPFDRASGIPSGPVPMMSADSQAARQDETPEAATEQDPVPVTGDPQTDEWLKRLHADRPGKILEAVLEIDEKSPLPGPVLDRLLDLTFYQGTLKEGGEFVRMAAEQVLARQGEAVNARLDPYLNSDQLERIVIGMNGMRIIGPVAASRIPKLKELLDSRKEHQIKMGVMFVLEAMGPAAEPMLDDMIRLLSDPDFNVQQVTCRALTAMGPLAKRAAPEVVKVIETGWASPRSRALTTLGAIGPVEGIDTVGILRKWIMTYLVLDRERGLDGLARMGPAAIGAKEEVEKLMYNDNGSVRPHAAYTYWRITGETEKPMTVLREMLKRRDDQNAALNMLEAMGPTAAPALDEIASLLTNEEASLRESVLLALKGLGDSAASVRPQLEQYLQTEEDLLLKDLARQILAGLAAPDSKPAPSSPPTDEAAGGKPGEQNETASAPGKNG